MDADARGITGAKLRALSLALVLLLGTLTPAAAAPSSMESSMMEAASVNSAPMAAASSAKGSRDEPARAHWRLPVAAEELRPFAKPPSPWGAGHRGLDLGPLSLGATIRAPAEGEVSFTGVVVDRPVLSIRHGNGYLSSFEPVETTLEVGDRVGAGDPVGTLAANAGHCAQPCLHWGVRLYGEYINPLLLTGDLEPSVLLPLGEG